MKHIILENILTVSPDLQTAVLDIRNQDTIRAAMYTDQVITAHEHQSWLKALEHDTRQHIFVVKHQGQAVGVISLNALDTLHKKSDWAFYLAQTQRGGLGAALEWTFINHAFDTVGLEKLNCEVLETNPAVVALHKRFQFQEEGFRRSNIEKEGKRIGVHLLGLTRDDWTEHKAHIYQDHLGILEKFSITFSPSHS